MKTYIDSIWEILVPTVMNNKPVRTKHHKEWDKYVRSLSGGLTILQTSKGQWIDEGKIFYDRIIPVRVYCSRKHIEKIVDFTIKHYRQISVMAYKISNEVIIKRNDEGA